MRLTRLPVSKLSFLGLLCALFLGLLGLFALISFAEEPASMNLSEPVSVTDTIQFTFGPLMLVSEPVGVNDTFSYTLAWAIPTPTPTASPTVSPTPTVSSTPTPSPSPTSVPRPGDVNNDGRINCLDITQCELCILYPLLYPKENYPGWDANEDSTGPNAGDILAVELRILGLWPP